MRTWMWFVWTAGAATPAVQGLLAQYGSPGDAARGSAAWTQEWPGADGPRSCTTCHGPSLDAPGKHATTGEPIDPMTAADRLTDPAKIEKWFGRNCRWTMGRECTPAEKADFLTYLSGGSR
ncbi:MAG: DUF1924 domain-containing protein [Myxococcota bacterium]